MSWVTFVCGLWLIVAPFALGYREVGSATANDVILGILVATFSLWNGAIAEQAAGISWVITFFGLWVVVAQFIFGYAGEARAETVNDLVLGFVIAALALAQATELRRARATSR